MGTINFQGYRNDRRCPLDKMCCGYCYWTTLKINIFL